MRLKEVLKIPEILRKEHPFNKDGKVGIFLICIVVSFFFWTLNTLSKPYTTRINFPVKYINLPKNKVVSSPLPDSFELQVNAYGLTLLRHKLKMSFSPIVINVNEITDRIPEKNNLSRYAISTYDKRNIIEDQISSEIEVLNIYPDSLIFFFDDIIEEKIAVKPSADISLDKQYIFQRDIYTTPDSVTARGPKSIIDTLTFVTTATKRFKNVNHNISRNVHIESIPGVEISPRKVSLNIPVEQFTEANCEIPIILKNIPDSFSVKIFPGKVKVSYMVGLSHYKSISDGSFRATINFKNDKKADDKLTVTMEKYPKQVFSFDYFPKQVEYILEKKNGKK